MDVPEGNDDPTGATHREPSAPAFALSASQDREAFLGAFGGAGVRDSFAFDEFAALVAGWGLRHFTAAELLRMGSQHVGRQPTAVPR